MTESGGESSGPPPTSGETSAPHPSTTGQNPSWETYTNLKVGYSIQYPANWISDPLSIGRDGISEGVHGVDFGRYKIQRQSPLVATSEFIKAGYFLSILVDIDGDETIDDVIQTHHDFLKNRAGYRKEKVKFNRLTAYRIYNSGANFLQDALVVAKDGKIFQFRLIYIFVTESEKIEAQNIYELMLNSFRFVK